MMKNTIRRTCVVAGLMIGAIAAQAVSHDAQINIDRALNSPTLAVRYSGVHAALVELRVNGESLGTRLVTASKSSGETTFNLNLKDLKDGDNDLEIRLFDRTGKLVGSERSNISTEQSLFAPVSLVTPKVGQTIIGPAVIKLGFGQELKNVYVSFFVDNNFKAMTNYPPYQYSWDSTRESNGWHEIEAWAIDDTSTTYKTRKVKVFVDNPGGHTYRAGLNDDTAVPSRNPDHTGVTAATEEIRVNRKSSRLSASNPSAPMAPNVRNGVVALNSVHARLSDTTQGEKPLTWERGIPTGLRHLTPTGTRIANAKLAMRGPIEPHIVASVRHSSRVAAITHPALSAESGHVLHTNYAPADSVTRTSASGARETGGQPSEITIVVQPSVSKTRSTSVRAAEASPRASVHENSIQRFAVREDSVPPSSVYSSVSRATHLLPITRGRHIPNIGSFVVVMNSEFVNFDVPTRVDAGVPMAPLRHLLEKSGGVVDWANKTKTLNAKAAGNSIFVQIGDKVAKINDAQVLLELAPYIDRGRTIVPVSFLRDALNVDVEYDKVTGHVLITKIKR